MGVSPNQGLGFRGTIVGAPIMRTIVYWGLYWGPPILGNSHISNGESISFEAASPGPCSFGV